METGASGTPVSGRISVPRVGPEIAERVVIDRI